MQQIPLPPSHTSPAKGVFSSEAWRQRPLLKRVVDGGGLSEQVAHCHAQTWNQHSTPFFHTHADHTKKNSRSHLSFTPSEERRHKAFFKHAADYIIWELIQNEPTMLTQRIETAVCVSGTCAEFTDLWRAPSTAASEQLCLWWISCLWGSPGHSHTLHTQTQRAERAAEYWRTDNKAPHTRRI